MAQQTQIKNRWFKEVFLESFEEGRYHAQDGWIKPWQYKNLMKLAADNHWKMLSQKQLDIFLRYAPLNRSTFEEWADFETDTKRVKIRISNHNGFTTIDIYDIRKEEE